MFGFTTSTTTMDELKNADIIMVINTELTDNNLVAELKIKAAMKKGSRLIAINSSENALSKIADLWLDPKRGTNTALIAGLANSLIKNDKLNHDFIKRRGENYSEYKNSISALTLEKTAEITGVQVQKLNEILEMLRPDTNLVIVYGLDQYLDKSRDDLKALANLMLQLGKVGQSGNGLILIRDYANSQGLLDMGVDSRYLPGYGSGSQKQSKRFNKLWNVNIEEIFKPVDIMKMLRSKKIKALLIFGENPLLASAAHKLLQGLQFVMLLDHFKTATADEADVVLPASTPLESEGTFTACDRRVQRSMAIFPPKSGFSNREIITMLAEKLAMPLQLETVAAIFKEIQQANPFYQTVSANDFWGNGLFRKSFHTANGKGNFFPLTIELATCNQEKQNLLASETYLQLKIKNKLMV
jgi:formate dehydrogenase major subunit